MPSSSYIVGALDALVKAGEISPAYAAGVCDTLEKDATWLPWADSDEKNIEEALEAFQHKHGRLPYGNEMTDVMRSARHWYTDLGRRSSTWWGNKWRKFKNAINPAGVRSGESFDLELESDQAKQLHDWYKAKNPRMTADEFKAVATWEDSLNKLQAERASQDKALMPLAEWKKKYPQGTSNIAFSPMTKSLIHANYTNSASGYRLRNDYTPRGVTRNALGERVMYRGF